MLIFAPHRFKCCNLHDQKHFFLNNGVMTTPKRRILSFIFTILCFKKSLLIRSIIICAVDQAFRSRWLDRGTKTELDGHYTTMLTSSLVTFVVLASDLVVFSRQQICNLFSDTASFISSSFLNVFLCRPNSNH